MNNRLKDIVDKIKEICEKDGKLKETIKDTIIEIKKNLF